ncbi:MAG: hypothetical protein AB8F74_01680 [Saprospiraceae bacterium]
MNDKNIIWSELTTLKPNIWGIRSMSGRITLDPLSRHSDYNRISPLAVILFSLIIIPLGSIVIGSFLGIIVAYIFAACCAFILIYWLIIREIKYYQITKSMKYELTNDSLIFKYYFFGKEVTKEISLSEIRKIHLVKFKEDDIVTGSIYIYFDKEIKFYSVSKKERTNQAVIERVNGFEKFIELFNGLKN